MNLFKILKEVKNNQGIKSKVVVLIFRLSNYYASKNVVVKLIGFPFFIINKIFNEFLFCVEIPYKTNIAPGLKIYHPHAIVINENVTIGCNCVLRQGVTIGNILLKTGEESASPVIGDNVEFGANVIAIGNIVIGNASRLGAGSVITKNIAEGKTVIGYGFRELN